MLIRFMPCPCNDHLRVGVFYLKKRSHFPFKCLLMRNIIADLNIDFFICICSCKIYLKVINFTYCYIITLP